MYPPPKRTYRRHPPELRAKAIALRQQGYSIYELRDLLGIRLATVQGWVRGISLSEKAKERIRCRIVDGGRAGRRIAVDVNRKRIEAWKQGIHEKNRRLLQGIEITPDLAKLFCALLYSCEGAKYPSARMLGFSNSDPVTIQCFLWLLRNCFGVDERKFRCQIVHRWDQSLNFLIAYWSGVTGIPPTQFYRSKPDARTKGKKTLRKNYRGVCCITYFDVTLQYTLQNMAEVLMKNIERVGGAGENRTLNPSMPWRYDPISPQPQGVT